MLRIQMIGLAIMAALAMSAVAAGSAMAAHEWLINKKPITTATKVHSLGLLLLSDDKIPALEGGPVQIHCHGYNAGTVGPGGLDLIESITTELLKGSDKIPCTFDKAGGCKSNVTPTALALHLPWRTEIILQGTKVRDLILADGNGEPGWNVTCQGPFGETQEDECLAVAGEPASTGLVNDTGIGVLAIFNAAETTSAKCTKGGAKSGLVNGTVLIESPSASEPLSFI